MAPTGTAPTAPHEAEASTGDRGNAGGAGNRRGGRMMQGHELLRWGVRDSMRHHGVDSPANLLREVARYRLGNNTLR